MTRLICLLILLATGAVALADQQEQIDDGNDFIVNRDVPYVPARLDKKVEPMQTLDIYRPKDVPSSPVILYIHGGGWAFGDKQDVHVKPRFFTQNNFAFVSMNYRLRWDHKVYDQLVDIVRAIRWLETEGPAHGLDGSRVVLMGHAAGGHLASLVMTDPSYLQAEEMSGRSVKAVVSIDSTSYDIPRLMRELGSFVERRQHELIFGNEEKVWRAASPITHLLPVEAESLRYVPAFALLYKPEVEVSNLQARGFARALGGAGIQVVMIPGSSDDPAGLDEALGSAGNLPTVALMAFIRSQI